MTENECIDVLKNLAFLSTNQEHEKCEESIKMAIQALEKQIPKKPIDKLMYLECPSCGDVGIEDCGYCPCCGQALDWQ